MPGKINLRKLYRPIQPAIKQTGSRVLYKEILANHILEDIIYCYWELRTTEKLDTSFIYRVVADGCIDIFFQLDKPDESFVMGFCNNYTEFALENDFHYVGIRFFPTMFPALFQIDAKELTNRFERLELIIRDTSAFIQRSFSTKDSLEDIKTKLDSYFSDRIRNRELTIDTRFQNALDIILKKSGVVSIQKDLETGLSTRQLRRYFEYYVGDTPKTFSQVVRFQNILNAKPSMQSLKSNTLFFDLGYFDQAHFIKEFKNFYGVTPSKAFGR